MGATVSSDGTSSIPVCGEPPCEKTPTSSPHKASLIFLHGMGDQGDNWAEILSSRLEKYGVKVICPNASSRQITVAFGIIMPAWFDIIDMGLNTPQDGEGVKRATEYVHSLVQKEIDSGIDPKKIAIGGFSMGAALALHATLAYEKEIGAAVALSTFLLHRDFVRVQSTANKSLPVFIGHGTYDITVPYKFGVIAMEKLKTFNPNVVFKSYEAYHLTTEEELDDTVAFLKQSLGL